MFLLTQLQISADTLHRFWKKEHDWGWKKFMELSKVLEGFIDADTLIIKAQVQVIRYFIILICLYFIFTSVYASYITYGMVSYSLLA